ncbi:threonine-phosphate decarboxylase CobD [Roseicyclus marinus]|uniref:threonine-phosphate decarboxylase CobD n=1 Tax=Roseicyclus marinus TaxID=2161673 RepID=UPI0024101DF0|nr:threonine-phosphate decarboxylase CobD [Roseicyclus marinus]MDG3039751.1 threonine-phosphate decarboxylase CobD [Roseicyclus marinus]
MTGQARDHGGDLDRARAAYGGGDWIDLSTGINPLPYPMPQIPPHALNALPTATDMSALQRAAAKAYGARTGIVALAGAQAAIQLVPRLRPAGTAAVLSPSYNEHAAALAAQGWQVRAASDLSAMAGADLAVVVNPNNPDGRVWPPEGLARLAGDVGLLVVDESFADPTPHLSLCPQLHDLGERALVLRSFGKFYGLAGLRLGFALGGAAALDRLRALSGPWAVSGPAIVAGTAALADETWQQATRARLARDAERLDAIAARAGWSLVGGTTLFRTFETGDAMAARDRLARARIWTRAFPYSTGWLRLGLPGHAAGWDRLENALAGSGQ